MPALSASTLVAVGSFVSVLVAAAAVHHARASTGPTATPLPPSAVLPQLSTPGVVRALGSLAAPDDPHERESVRTALVQAGFAGRAALPTFLALRTAATVALPVAGWIVLQPASVPRMMLVVLLGAALGYYGTAGALEVIRGRRVRRIRRAVPNMLDMLVSCVEAGLGIDVALHHVARDVQVASPELAAELNLINAELSAGLPRTQAFGLLERRTGVAELAALANVLGVVERFGAGIAQSLRAHAHLSRRRRALEAETRAARAAPALTVVMVIFILPVLFVVLIGSTVVNVSHVVRPQVLASQRVR